MAAVHVERRLAAILAADIVGYSRLVEQDEAGTLAAIKALREGAIDPLLAEHHGRIVKLMGDGAIAEFASVVDAVACAVAVQNAVAEAQGNVPPDRRIVFRIGINLGDVVVEGDDLLGDGVNVAARLEQLCEPGGVLVSGTAYDHLQGRFGLPLEFTGEQQVKNLARPVRAYRVRLDGLKPSARPAIRQLRRWAPRAAAALLAAALAGGVWWLWPQEAPSGPQGPNVADAAAPVLDTRRLAVLPFTNISADAKDEWFADGITEEMIARLSSIPELSVIARTSIMGYKGTSKGVAEIGRELGAGTILEGSVRRAADQVRVTAQLIDSRSQAHLWAESYDRPVADIFAVQSDVAKKVADALTIELLAEVKQRVDRPGTTDSVAHDLYMKARREYYESTPQSFRQAISDYEAAISRDPFFAMAYAGLAELWLDAYWVLNVAPRQAVANATAAAEKALALDNELAVAHAVLAYAKFFTMDWAGAEAGFKRALELNPNSAQALDGYSWGYLTQIRGRYDEALAGMRRAGELDPLFVPFATDLGWVLYHAGRYDLAIEQFQRVVEMAPDYLWGYMGLGASHIALRRYDEAVRWHEKGVETSGGNSIAKGRLSWAYARAGRRDEALAILDELKSQYALEKFSPMDFIFAYQGLGDMDNAFLWLERAYEVQDYQMVFLQSREFEDLWADPRFAAMKARIGFPPRG